MILGYRILSRALFLLLFLTIIKAQDCDSSEVELWDNCYSIESTTEIDLTGLNIYDEIPASIGALTNLISLNLQANHFSGSIPPEIGNLSNLIHLYIQNNDLTGSIPSEIGNLVSLTDLKLYNNDFSGSIPSEIGNLINLDVLYLQNNNLSGPIPSEIGNLTKLTSLSLSDNSINGEIPSEIGNLINLTRLYLYDNQLTGIIPYEFENLIHLNYLKLHENQLTGQIPCSMCDLDLEWNNSSYFNISSNQLCPPYPECSQDNIFDQDTTNCNLIPERQFDFWGQCYMIENTDTLNLGNIGLTGSIPIDIGKLTNLTHLYLYDNELSGEIPSELGDLIKLEHLYLYNNNISGDLPPNLGDLENLTQMYLYSNELSGEIPSELGALLNLEQLFLHNNQLTGAVPPEVTGLNTLNYLYLNDNRLDQNINESICTSFLEWDNSIYFNIYNNSLCPPYPFCVEDYLGYQDTINCSQDLFYNGETPIKYKLYNPFPNPFNPSTTLSYDLSKSTHVNILIYDIMGRVVTRLVNKQENAGRQSILWDGTNQDGESVASGVYYSLFETVDLRSSKKLILLK